MRYLAFIIAALTSAEMQAFGLAPRLVVNVTIDQLRTDYMEAFYPLYGQGGFRRLMQQGLVYEGGRYPFSPVDRSSATATLSSGATPYLNGIVGTQWLDRSTLRPVNCVSDDKYGYSPQRLLTSTLGDELKMSSNGSAIVFSFSSDKESAILSAGHAADGAFWMGDNGAWTGTRYYANALPSWLKAYNSQHPELGRVQAMANDNVVSVSLQAVTAEEMGRDEMPDLLYVNLSAARAKGKESESWQTCMETVYMQLDHTLASLISGVEQRVGKDKVLFVVTSTGYSDEARKNLEKYRVPTGTFYINRTASLLNIYLSAIYGQGRYVEQCYGNEMYLNHKLIEQKRISMNEILGRSQDFLIQNAGVADVYTSERLMAGNNDILKIRNGYNPTNCGDIIIEVAPGWKLLNEDTHQVIYSSAGFMPFPIIFLGGNKQHEVIKTPVTVDCVASTIAKAIRIRAPNACSAAPLF
jgi:hypothetical protein